VTARPGYRVVRARPDQVRAELERLWADNLTVEGGVRAKYDWLYRDAPLPADAVFMLRTDDGAAVGTAGIGMRDVQLGGRLVRAGVVADLAVDKAHRSVGPALALVREAKQWGEGAVALLYGFPNKLAQGVFKRVGYQQLGAMARYARPLRHRQYAGRLEERHLHRAPAALRGWLIGAAQQPGLALAAGLALDARKLGRDLPRAWAARQLKHGFVEGPDARLDALWARARGEYAIVAARTLRFLAWRFPPRPGRTWRLAVERGTDALRAYAVVDRVDGIAYIRDLFGHKADVVTLLDRLPLGLYRTGAASMSMRYLGASWLSEALLARGFAVRQADRMIAIAPGLPVAGGPELRDVSAWHLTDADEDT